MGTDLRSPASVALWKMSYTTISPHFPPIFWNQLIVSMIFMITADGGQHRWTDGVNVFPLVCRVCRHGSIAGFLFIWRVLATAFIQLFNSQRILLDSFDQNEKMLLFWFILGFSGSEKTKNNLAEATAQCEKCFCSWKQHWHIHHYSTHLITTYNISIWYLRCASIGNLND